MADQDWLAERFEAQRTRLQAVAYRMLGSLSEADDAVQESWIRLSRSDTTGVENLAGWLTTVVARVCLDMLRSRASRREEPLAARVTEPLVSSESQSDPEHEALLADSVGLALLVVLNRLAPAERVAFVLHDVFALPFDQIAPIVERTPSAAKKLASRARLRVHGTDEGQVATVSSHRPIIDAFLAATRNGDLTALLAVLDPDVVRRADRAGLALGVAAEARGAQSVATTALASSQGARFAQLALINGSVGVIVAPRGRLLLALTFTIANARITEIDVIADPVRLDHLEVAVLAG
jgi:RNA polymerase sigma factor (sigma-70 family)